MAFPCYLAMTAAEILRCEKIPPNPAYLSCHFSPYGKGLSAVPPSLPPDTLLILTDRTPVCGHDAELVAQQLCDAAARLKCCGILLDLQRPDVPEAPAIVKALGLAKATIRTPGEMPFAMYCPLTENDKPEYFAFAFD